MNTKSSIQLVESTNNESVSEEDAASSTPTHVTLSLPVGGRVKARESELAG